MTGGRVTLLDDTNQPLPVIPTDADRFIGWEDGADGGYLIPDVAREKVERLIGKAGLGHLSNRALYTQLEALGAIATHDRGKSLKTIKVDGKARKVLHLAPAALSDE